MSTHHVNKFYRMYLILYPSHLLTCLLNTPLSSPCHADIDLAHPVMCPPPRPCAVRTTFYTTLGLNRARTGDLEPNIR